MSWMEKTAMDSRLLFIGTCLLQDEAMSVCCARAGISRRTGYKWLGRYRMAGAVGLEALSSSRHTQSGAIDPGIQAQLLALRCARPTWGPRKVLARLGMDQPDIAWPAASTVGDLFRRAGLVTLRPRRSRDTGEKPPLIEPSAPNVSWAMDFKGWFRTGDGIRCEPLTVTDGFSRYLLACEAVPRVTAACVRPILTRLFQAHGLPGALRSDNGSPFATRMGLAGLSQLSVWMLRLNIWPDRIDPGRPDQNGRHERMHRVLGEDTAHPPASTLAGQQTRLDRWREDYNTYRPHEALGQRCPATLYCPSPRTYPETIADWDYPADHHRRSVSTKGYVRWRDGQIYLTEALRGETVAFARRDDGEWAIRFRQFDLAILSDQTNQIDRSGLARSGQART